MKAAAVLMAAGRGERFGSAKQFAALGGRALIDWSVEALRGAGLDEIVVALTPGRDQEAQRLREMGLRIAWGGDTRTASVRAGLAALTPTGWHAVLIHDAARPGLTPEIVTALLAALEDGWAGVAPALPLSDALKRAGPDGGVEGEAGRAGIMRVQTPQAFRADAIFDAYARLAAGQAFDDDLAVLHSAGYACRLIPGDHRLLKVTFPDDLVAVERAMGLVAGDAGQGRIAVGAGFDAHRFGPGDHVTLCGVRIPHDKGLIGHSDADAGWHALTDAILGAAALDDIGAHFPPSDPRWGGASSDIFLMHALDLARRAGAVLGHVDITLICERPRIGPYREAMRIRTADVLGLSLDQVSVKATTTEKMGFTGRGEGLAAQATATLRRR